MMDCKYFKISTLVDIGLRISQRGDRVTEFSLNPIKFLENNKSIVSQTIVLLLFKQ